MNTFNNIVTLLSTQKFISPIDLSLFLELLPENVITFRPKSLAVLAALTVLGDSPLTLVRTTASFFMIRFYCFRHPIFIAIIIAIACY